MFLSLIKPLDEGFISASFSFNSITNQEGDPSSSQQMSRHWTPGHLRSPQVQTRLTFAWPCGTPKFGSATFCYVRIQHLIIADCLFIKSKFNFSFDSFDLNIKTIKEKPVIIRKRIKIKIPLDESDTNECTLVSIPDLTRKVPKILNEKHNIDKKTIHFVIS